VCRLFTAVGGASCPQTASASSSVLTIPRPCSAIVGADDPAAVQRQNGQRRLAPQAVHRPRLTPNHNVDWSQQTYLHP
jgi:hypothetical protein